MTNTGTPISTLDALQAWYKVVTRSLKESAYDLSSRQMGIMLTVYLTPPPHTIKSLAEKLNISKPAICRAVDALSLEGLLRRKKDEDDKRNVLLQRTVKGSVYLSEFADLIVSEIYTQNQPAEETSAKKSAEHLAA